MNLTSHNDNATPARLGIMHMELIARQMEARAMLQTVNNLIDRYGNEQAPVTVELIREALNQRIDALIVDERDVAKRIIRH